MSGNKRGGAMSDHHGETDINDLGLQADLSMWQRRPLERRRILQMGLVGIGVLLSSCSSASGSTGGGACVSEIPEETAGPYPANGSSGGPGDGDPVGTPPGPPSSNTSSNASPPSAMQSGDGDAVNVLTRSGIVRSDVRTSLETGNTAPGVPTTIQLQLVNASGACAPLAGYALYLWHCTRAGEYSLYSETVLEEDYLRGVQETDEDGMVTFQTIFPACYTGRWPHVHFELYPSLDQATSAANKLHTSQLALPQTVCEAVYNNAEGYSSSVANLAELSLDTDNVFSDGYALQMAAVTGSISKGYTVTLQVGLSV